MEDCLSPSYIQTWIAAVGAVLSGLATIGVVVMAFLIHRREKKLAQRQLLIPLWDHMATLSSIDPTKPVTPDVIKAVNTLELVALSCEGELVDPALIRRTFRERYMEFYKAIESVQLVSGTGKSGKDLLRENRAAVQFYRELEEERLSQDRVRV